MNGGVEVGGVAEEEYPPGLEARCQPGPEGVGGGTGDLQAVQVPAPGPGFQEPAQGVGGGHASFVLAVVQLELPPVAVAGDLHEGGRLRGVADLLHAVPGVQGRIGADVDDEPALGEPEVVHGDSGQLADRAVGAVAAQHVAAGECLLGRLTVEARAHLDRGAGDRAGRIVQPADFGPAAEVDQGVLFHPGQQELFQVWLVEHVRLREAVHADLVFAAELGHHPVAGVEQPQPAARPGLGQEIVADAESVKGPRHLVV